MTCDTGKLARQFDAKKQAYQKQLQGLDSNSPLAIELIGKIRGLEEAMQIVIMAKKGR
tara:strand:+ start:419 stop:592 length:174 start_codon:yes stop_codon:yes gene_type:complete